MLPTGAVSEERKGEVNTARAFIRLFWVADLLDAGHLPLLPAKIKEVAKLQCDQSRLNEPHYIQIRAATG
jgi:hypothetical protein